MSNIIEPLRNPEPQPLTTPEDKRSENYLNLEKYRSLYGHLILAGLSENVDVKSLLEPVGQLDRAKIDEVLSNGKSERKYNPATQGLSMYERNETWKNKSFDQAYHEWSGGLLSSIHLADTDPRKAVINHFLGKDKSSVTDADVQTLYDTYCRNGSNIDAFVKKALESQIDKNETEWLARKLFGKRTAAIVPRLIEIEFTYIALDDNARVNNLFLGDAAIARLNNPTNEEKELLNLLSRFTAKLRTTHLSSQSVHSQRLSTPRSTQPASPGPPIPQSTPGGSNPRPEATRAPEVSSDDLKIRARMILSDREDPNEKYYLRGLAELALVTKLKEAIELAKTGERPIDPTTGKVLMTQTIDQAVSYLGGKLQEAISNQRRDLGREFAIVRIRDGQTVTPEGTTKDDIGRMIFSENPKYVRDPLERQKILGKNGQTYILQTFFDPKLNQEFVRIYSGPDDANEKFVKQFSRSDFDEMLDAGATFDIDDKDDVQSGTFMAGNDDDEKKDQATPPETIMPEATPSSTTQPKPDMLESAAPVEPEPISPSVESSTPILTLPEEIEINSDLLKERIKTIEEAISIAKSGEIPIDPTTGEPYATKSPEETIKYLETLQYKARTDLDDLLRKERTRADDAKRINGD